MNQAPTPTARSVMATPTMSSTTVRIAPGTGAPRRGRSSRVGRPPRRRYRRPSGQQPQGCDVEEGSDRQQEEQAEHPDVEWHGSEPRKPRLNEPSTTSGGRFLAGGRWPEPIAATAGADDDLRVSRVVLQLLTQALNEGPEVVALAHMGWPPDFPQQRPVVDHRAGAPSQL